MVSYTIKQTVVENLNADLDGKQPAGDYPTNASLTESLQSNLLNYTTNRILEIPQDIKLELNNGTLTLKAGSKVYVPNESGNFDVITTTQDYAADTSSYSGMYVLSIVNGNPTGVTIITNPVSGDTAPTSPVSLQGWYDTTNNLVKRYNKGWQTPIYSFPLAICTSDGTNITSIDQVFNGLGYIGSTVFALPGVKVQNPNGRNADGTYKSGVLTLNSVITRAMTGGASDKWIIFSASNVYLNSKTNEVFDADSNYWKYNGTKQVGVGCLGSAYFDGTKISSFTPYTVDSILNSSLSNLSAAGQAKFNAKANTDLSNVTSNIDYAIFSGNKNDTEIIEWKSGKIELFKYVQNVATAESGGTLIHLPYPKDNSRAFCCLSGGLPATTDNAVTSFYCSFVDDSNIKVVRDYYGTSKVTSCYTFAWYYRQK